MYNECVAKSSTRPKQKSRDVEQKERRHQVNARPERPRAEYMLELGRKGMILVGHSVTPPSIQEDARTVKSHPGVFLYRLLRSHPFRDRRTEDALAWTGTPGRAFAVQITTSFALCKSVVKMVSDGFFTDALFAFARATRYGPGPHLERAGPQHEGASSADRG